jgi:hypothetical protein
MKLSLSSQGVIVGDKKLSMGSRPISEASSTKNLEVISIDNIPSENSAAAKDENTIK